jgi:hypothetical protein
MATDRVQIPSTLWSRLWLLGLIVVMVLFAILHVLAGGMHH